MKGGEMTRADLVVAGGGIVGLMIARQALLRNPFMKVLVLEKENQLGVHASGRNSGVLHTGIYYAKDSLKAKFCAVGSKQLKAYAVEQGILTQSLGKVIVAQSEGSYDGLLNLEKRARENQVLASFVDSDALKNIEPYAKTFKKGLHLTETASIDSKAVLKTVAREIQG